MLGWFPENGDRGREEAKVKPKAKALAALAPYNNPGRKTEAKVKPKPLALAALAPYNNPGRKTTTGSLPRRRERKKAPQRAGSRKKVKYSFSTPDKRICNEFFARELSKLTPRCSSDVDTVCYLDGPGGNTTAALMEKCPAFKDLLCVINYDEKICSEVSANFGVGFVHPDTMASYFETVHPGEHLIQGCFADYCGSFGTFGAEVVRALKNEKFSRSAVLAATFCLRGGPSTVKFNAKKARIQEALLQAASKGGYRASVKCSYHYAQKMYFVLLTLKK